MHRIYKSTNKFIINAKLFNQESDSRFVIRINTIKKSVSQQRSKVSFMLIRSNARMFECSRNIFLEVSYWFLNTISSEYSSFFSLIEHQYLFVCDLRGYTSGVLQVCVVARDLGEVHRDQEKRRDTFRPGNEPTSSRGQGQAQSIDHAIICAKRL